MACSCAAHNNASPPIFKSLLDIYCQVLSSSTCSGISLTNCLCIFFSCQFCLSSGAFCFFKFSTRCNIFSVDYLNRSNSLNEVFFRIANMKTQIIFLFSNSTFRTHQISTSRFPLYVKSVHNALRM